MSTPWITYKERLEQVRQDAIAYIKQILTERGTGYELINPDAYNEDEDEPDEELFTMPYMELFDKKKGRNKKYYFVAISILSDGTLKFHCLNGKDLSDESILETEDLDTSVICNIADRVWKLEN